MSPVIQNLVDSLCQCFGSQSPTQPNPESFSSSAADNQRNNGAPATPDVKRRTRSLALQDKQWDALFSQEQVSTPARGRAASASPPPQKHSDVSIEQAQAVAKAKLAATSGRSRRAPKRKRSRDDIFRSKKQENPRNSNAFSRFLSNNPVFMNSLCFATPIRDSQDAADTETVVSDSNTLNTAEDTITSTLYYETTKLAGLKQKNPPMPLFNTFAVEEKDDIHNIVKSHSHSSVRLLDMYRQCGPDDCIDFEVSDEEEVATPPASPKRSGTAATTRTTGTQSLDDTPPPVTKLSEDSSKSSSAR